MKKFVAKHTGVVIRAMGGQGMGGQGMGGIARPMATIALMIMMLVAVAACGKMGPVEAPPDSPPFPQTYPRY
jgi:hypothetical protein